MNGHPILTILGSMLLGAVAVIVAVLLFARIVYRKAVQGLVAVETPPMERVHNDKGRILESAGAILNPEDPTRRRVAAPFPDQKP